MGLSEGMGGSVRRVGPAAVSVEPGAGVGVGEIDFIVPMPTPWLPDCVPGEGLSWTRTALSTKTTPTPFSQR